jgi:toxin ParE1/3/4
MKPVDFDSEAEAEYLAAANYYEDAKEGLGFEFTAAVEDSMARIAQTPQAFSPYKIAGIRKFVLRRFPYSIFFLELNDRIWITAVAHQHRKPGYWYHRIRDVQE